MCNFPKGKFVHDVKKNMNIQPIDRQFIAELAATMQQNENIVTNDQIASIAHRMYGHGPFSARIIDAMSRRLTNTSISTSCETFIEGCVSEVRSAFSSSQVTTTQPSPSTPSSFETFLTTTPFPTTSSSTITRPRVTRPRDGQAETQLPKRLRITPSSSSSSTTTTTTTSQTSPVTLSSPQQAICAQLQEVLTQPLTSANTQAIVSKLSQACASNIPLTSLIALWRSRPEILRQPYSEMEDVRLFLSLYVQALQGGQIPNKADKLQEAITCLTHALSLGNNDALYVLLRKIHTTMQEVASIPELPRAPLLCLDFASRLIGGSHEAENMETHLARFLFLLDRNRDELRVFLRDVYRDTSHDFFQNLITGLATQTQAVMQHIEQDEHPQSMKAAITGALPNPRLLPENHYANRVAFCLIRPDGSLNRSLIADAERFFIRRTPVNNPATEFDAYLAQILLKFRVDNAENSLNNAFAQLPARLSEDGQSAIRLHLHLTPTANITPEQIQRVRLASLLARWRQFDTHTCYIMALSNFQRSVLHRVIEGQRQLLEDGCVYYTIEGRRYPFQGLNAPFQYSLNYSIGDNGAALMQIPYIANAIRLLQGSEESDMAFQTRIHHVMTEIRDNATLLQLFSRLLPEPRNAEGQRRFERACRIVSVGFEPPLSRMFDNAMASAIFPPFNATGRQQNALYEIYRDSLTTMFRRLVFMARSGEAFASLPTTHPERQALSRYDTTSHLPDADPQHWRPPGFSQFRFFATPSQNPADTRLNMQLYMNTATASNPRYIQVTEENFGEALQHLMMAAMQEQHLPTMAAFLRSFPPATLASLFRGVNADDTAGFDSRFRVGAARPQASDRPWNFTLTAVGEAFWSTISETPPSPHIRIAMGNTPMTTIQGMLQIVSRAASLRREISEGAAEQGIAPQTVIETAFPLNIPGHVCLFTPHTIQPSIPCDTIENFTAWTQQRMQALGNLPITNCPLTYEAIQGWVRDYTTGISQGRVNTLLNELQSSDAQRMTLQAYIQFAVRRAHTCRQSENALFSSVKETEQLQKLDNACIHSLSLEQRSLMQGAAIRYADTNWEAVSEINTSVPRDFCFCPTLRTGRWDNYIIARDWSGVELHHIHRFVLSSTILPHTEQRRMLIRNDIIKEVNALQKRFNNIWQLFTAPSLQAASSTALQELGGSWSGIQTRIRERITLLRSRNDASAKQQRIALTYLLSMLEIKYQYEQRVDQIRNTQRPAVHRNDSLFVTTVEAERRGQSCRSAAFFTIDPSQFLQNLSNEVNRPIPSIPSPFAVHERALHNALLPTDPIERELFLNLERMDCSHTLFATVLNSSILPVVTAPRSGHTLYVDLRRVAQNPTILNAPLSPSTILENPDFHVLTTRFPQLRTMPVRDLVNFARLLQLRSELRTAIRSTRHGTAAYEPLSTALASFRQAHSQYYPENSPEYQLLSSDLLRVDDLWNTMRV